MVEELDKLMWCNLGFDNVTVGLFFDIGPHIVAAR